MVKKAASKYICDSDCPMWKCSKLCSHTIACAYQDGCLQEFLAHTSGAPSFYALSKSSSTNAEKKPCKRKASSKSNTKDLREEINQLECTTPQSQGHPVVTGASCTNSSEPACSLGSMLQFLFHTYIYIYYAHDQVRAHTCTHTVIYTHNFIVHVQSCTCTCTCTHIHIYTYMYTHMHINNVCTQPHTNKHTHTHIHTSIHKGNA